MIVFRADAGPKIGAGHVMRCLSIADGFTCNKENIIFISADRNAEALIKSRGYKNIILESDALHPENEIGIFKSIGAYSEAELIIFDGYYFSKEYIGGFSREKTTVYMDDLVAEAMPANVIINYNLFADKLEYEKLYENCPSGPILILGTDYVPLRKEFSSLNPITINDKVRNVLVLTGGADPCHIAINLLEYLSDHKKGEAAEKLSYHFVVGTLSQDYEKIVSLSEKQGIDLHIYRNVKDIWNLMLKCDIAISAAGSTLYELCACGVPTITYTTADNQIKAEQFFSKKKIMLSAGDVRLERDFYKEMVSLIDYLSENKEARISLQKNACTLVDGKGAIRIAKIMKELVHS